jgi:cell shape-determining protein MreC
MKTSIAIILLASSFSAYAYDNHASDSVSQIQERLRQPMYYSPERLQEMRELEELKESNNLAREHLQLERDRISEERFQREINSE